MKKIENYENVQANSGEFARPTAGGYICKIIDVTDVDHNPNTGKGQYLKIQYDIASGDFAEYFKKQFDKWGGDWKANFVRSYKEENLLPDIPLLKSLEKMKIKSVRLCNFNILLCSSSDISFLI